MADVAYSIVLASVGLILAGIAFQRRNTRWGGWLVTGWVGVVATLWWAEVLLHVAAWGNGASMKQGHAMWTPRPLAVVADSVVPADMGAHASDTPTVLIVGDSFAAGQGVSNDDMLGSALGRSLGPGVRVLTLAMPGWSLTDELVMFSALGAQVEPEAVVWLFVYNDLGALTDPHDDLILLRGGRRRSRVKLLDRLFAIDWSWAVERRTEDAYIRALDPEREAYQQSFEALAALASSMRAAGVRPLFAPFPLLHRLDAYPFEAQHAALLASAAAAGWEPVDLLPAFRGAEASALWATRDDHHPNAEGHRLAASVLAQTIGSSLPDARRIGCDPLPHLAWLNEAMSAACLREDPAALVDTAEEVAPLQGRVLGGFWRGLHRARELAVVAAVWAGDDAAKVERAEAVIRRAQAPRSSDPMPPTD